MTTMYRYTLKMQENDTLLLINEQGEEVPATDILKRCAPRRVFALEGKMGVGKTTFIKTLCQTLGTTDVVNSPTFAIVNVYDIDGDVPQVYHFDCYRLQTLQEAVDLGAEEYLYSGNYCFIEWSDILRPILPDDAVRIFFCEQEDHTRTLSVDVE